MKVHQSESAKCALCALQAGSRISGVMVRSVGGRWIELEIETEHGRVRITGESVDDDGWHMSGNLVAERIK